MDPVLSSSQSLTAVCGTAPARCGPLAMRACELCEVCSAARTRTLPAISTVISGRLADDPADIAGRYGVLGNATTHVKNCVNPTIGRSHAP